MTFSKAPCVAKIFIYIFFIRIIAKYYNKYNLIIDIRNNKLYFIRKLNALIIAINNCILKKNIFWQHFGSLETYDIVNTSIC